MSWFVTPALAQQSKYYALFVVKFTDYIQWPVTNNPFVIGVYGDPSIISDLTKYTLAKSNIEIREIYSIGEVQNCQLVFLTDAKKGEFHSIKSSIGNKSILLVTESETFAKQGAGISFYTDGSKLRFRINKKTTDDQNLKISGSLLALADVM